VILREIIRLRALQVQHANYFALVIMGYGQSERVSGLTIRYANQPSHRNNHRSFSRSGAPTMPSLAAARIFPALAGRVLRPRDDGTLFCSSSYSMMLKI